MLVRLAHRRRGRLTGQSSLAEGYFDDIYNFNGMYCFKYYMCYICYI